MSIINKEENHLIIENENTIGVASVGNNNIINNTTIGHVVKKPMDTWNEGISRDIELVKLGELPSIPGNHFKDKLLKWLSVDTKVSLEEKVALSKFKNLQKIKNDKERWAKFIHSDIIISSEFSMNVINAIFDLIVDQFNDFIYPMISENKDNLEIQKEINNIAENIEHNLKENKLEISTPMIKGALYFLVGSCFLWLDKENIDKEMNGSI